LKEIADSDIVFECIESHGSAIVMRNPQYRLHKTFAAVRRNILKLFPLINADFRIHLIRDGESEVIDDFDRNIMVELCSLITLGEEFSSLCNLVPDLNLPNRGELVEARRKKTIPFVAKDNMGEEHEYTLSVLGWIGAYKTTRGRKAEITDFPDNFISIFANKKMGEFNILPVVGQNKLNEVYVVGQLHVDIFEFTELPDMALSNRQGYKSDDIRYERLLDYVRGELLADILKKRETYTGQTKQKKKKLRDESLRANEEKLRQAIDGFRKKASEDAARSISELGPGFSLDRIEKAISKSISDNSPDIGIKALVDSQKKKILISQTRDDKPFADIVYQMLLHNTIPSEDILYTNCDDDICRVPEGEKIYDYLRSFFVESYSSQKIFVLFITSENMKKSWGALSEVGASWITQIDHKIFNIYPFRPEHPLNDEAQWQSTNRENSTTGDLWMDSLNAQIFCQKIESVCDLIGYKKKSRQENIRYLKTLVSVRNY
jgi:hypothetical protein